MPGVHLTRCGGIGVQDPTAGKFLHVVSSPHALGAPRLRPAGNDLGDLDTADLVTEVFRGIGKWLWLVEAHLQTER
jgi:hypothetical protein